MHTYWQLFSVCLKEALRSRLLESLICGSYMRSQKCVANNYHAVFFSCVACKVSEKLGQTCWSPREMRSFFRFEALFQVFSFRCRSNSIDSSGCCYSNPFLGLVMLVFLTSVNFLQFLVRVFLILSVILQPIILEVIFVTVTENSSCDHPLLTYFS